MKRVLIAVLLAGSAFTGLSAQALTAEQTVERETVIRNADGTETIMLEKADMVTPGQKIVYSLNYYNELEEPAENIVLVMPIPDEVKLIEGSAEKPGIDTTYSVDGGNSFARRDTLTVKLADDTTRAAKTEDITHIRWMVEIVNPGERDSLIYKGVLK